MLDLTTRIVSQTEQERLFRNRALEEASLLFAQKGRAALDLVRKEARSSKTGPEDRRYHRLVQVEIERLDRLERNGASFSAVLVVNPPRPMGMGRFMRFLRWLSAPLARRR
jgi:hypothetical protein